MPWSTSGGLTRSNDTDVPSEPANPPPEVELPAAKENPAGEQESQQAAVDIFQPPLGEQALPIVEDPTQNTDTGEEYDATNSTMVE